jgi:hypothetical protein
MVIDRFGVQYTLLIRPGYGDAGNRILVLKRLFPTLPFTFTREHHVKMEMSFTLTKKQ